MRGIGRLKRVIRRHLPALLPGAPILLYHRVAEVTTDPWSLCVTPSRFAEHLDVLRKHTRAIPLRRISNGARPLPASAVAVTFDDGYADNLLNAMPLLESFDTPATIFVTTGLLDQDSGFWWDELEHLLLYPGRLPHSLQLVVAGNPHRWDIGESGSYSADMTLQYRGWKAWHKAPTSRHALYQQLYELLNPLGRMEQVAALEELRAWAGAGRSARRTHRTLSPQEVRTLDRSNLIEIGAHTVTHPNLAALAPPAQEGEIRRSKAHLEEILGHPISGFAYPFGRRCDYTQQTAALVRSSGFEYACSNFGGLATPATDRYQLPRMQVHDWAGDEFERRLKGWFGS